MHIMTVMRGCKDIMYIMHSLSSIRPTVDLDDCHLLYCMKFQICHAQMSCAFYIVGYVLHRTAFVNCVGSKK